MKKRKHTYGILTEANVDAYIFDLIMENKGDYITQSVAFNKTDPKQMKLLRMALLESRSFGAYVRELIANAHAGVSPTVVVQQTKPSNVPKQTQPNANARIAEGRTSSFYSK